MSSKKFWGDSWWIFENGPLIVMAFVVMIVLSVFIWRLIYAVTKDMG